MIIYNQINIIILVNSKNRKKFRDTFSNISHDKSLSLKRILKKSYV